MSVVATVPRAVSWLLTLAISIIALPVFAADLLREEQRVVVGGEEEIWRLVWPTPPSPVCAPEDVVSAITCPCSGFAYGEKGDLTLVRTRASREVERL